MLSAAPLPVFGEVGAVGSQTITTAASVLGRGQLRSSLSSGGARGFHPLPLGVGRVGRLRQSNIADCRRRAPVSVLQVDELLGGSGEEQEKLDLKASKVVEEVSNIVEDVSAGFVEVGEKLGGDGGGVENRMKQRVSKRKDEQRTYLLAAIASTLGFSTMAAAAVIYRFVWQMPASGEIPYAEIFGTFSLAGGAAVGMEYWARWAHKALWHASLWGMHESHHKPRDGPFEMNDVFAIINAVPAIALMLYGFLNKGLVPGLCFGAGLGITMFGIAYMFVHDGLVHRRFPVGPVAGVPYLQKVAAAHQLHHADLFKGVPYGLFLGPKELEKVGGEHELEKLLQQRGRRASGE